MKRTILYWLSFLSLMASSAYGYDEDTHFSSTYAMARHAGIRHEVALKIALSAQWMDESYISDPTSMILLPISGVRKRRLLHFPSLRRTGSVNAEIQGQVLGFESFEKTHSWLVSEVIKVLGFDGESQDLRTMNFWTETRPESPFATELLMEGLKEGNLMKAGASLHVLEDSFAHAGTPAEQGHAVFWHWPDRPFDDPVKYQRMVKSVFEALIAIRSQLPAEAIDKNLNSEGNAPNHTLGATSLAETYFRKVAPVISYNVLYDPTYVRTALKDFAERAVKHHYLHLDGQGIERMIDGLTFDGHQDAYKVLAQLMRSLAALPDDSNPLQVRYILDDMGKLPNESEISVGDYISSFGTQIFSPGQLNSDSFNNFIAIMARDLLMWNVPYALSNDHRMELESDIAAARLSEMELRRQNMRAFIQHEYGVDLEFVPNHTKDELGFGREIRREPEAEPSFSAASGITYATFNGDEKYRFDVMIFRYLLPHLTEENLHTIVDVIHRYNNSSALTAPLAIANAVYELRPILPIFVKDTVNERVNPKPDNFFYRNPELLERYRQQGRLTRFLGKNDAWTVDSLGLTAAALP